MYLFNDQYQMTTGPCFLLFSSITSYDVQRNTLKYGSIVQNSPCTQLLFPIEGFKCFHIQVIDYKAVI